jgi:hypothetical protein
MARRRQLECLASSLGLCGLCCSGMIAFGRKKWRPRWPRFLWVVQWFPSRLISFSNRTNQLFSVFLDIEITRSIQCGRIHSTHTYPPTGHPVNGRGALGVPASVPNALEKARKGIDGGDSVRRVWD